VGEYTAPAKAAGGSRARINVGNIWLDPLTEREVISIVRDAWTAGRGGSVITVNADIARAGARKPALAEFIDSGSLVLADGMPLVWVTRVAPPKLPERVAGSSLVLSLSEAAATDGRSVFVLGGADGVPTRAAGALCARFEGLNIAGIASPPFGFDRTDEGIRRVVTAVASAAPDLVLVGLGFPKQERLIAHLREAWPAAWYLACGAGISMAAGDFRRASPLMQKLGLEWVHRLVLEPRRLAGRYLRDDLPFALGLLGRAAVRRFRSAFPLGMKGSADGSMQTSGHAAGKPPVQSATSEQNWY
jgi:N-acetylglucosaminyldiphosphoundecaprenol N-acetyl-beta-D-mannosaminyltransferase